MQSNESPTAVAGSPRQIGRVPFALTLRTDATAYCPGCGNQLNHQATGIRYGVAWCWGCFNRDDDYPLRVAMMIICEPQVGHLSYPNGVTFYTPRLNNPGSYPALIDRLSGGDGRTDIPEYGETWPRWIPPHAEVIVYALAFHLLHPDIVISNEIALHHNPGSNGLTVLDHGTR